MEDTCPLCGRDLDAGYECTECSHDALKCMRCGEWKEYDKLACTFHCCYEECLKDAPAIATSSHVD